MTPLAQKIVNELTLPKKDRTFRDPGGLLDYMDDIHCFEVTQVSDVAETIGWSLHRQGTRTGRFPDKLAFLPAERTWLEWAFCEDGHFVREGVLLVQYEPTHAAALWAVQCQSRGLFLSSRKAGFLKLSGADMRVQSEWPFIKDMRDFPESQQMAWIVELYGLLAMINTPRIIGRKQHMPHAGLQRKLARAKGMVGKFPLHAWTEIVLEVTPPRIASDQGPHETRLTGAKAQHFCRCHLRVRLGQLELVSAHWRGDPALGIKQSRYRLAPGPVPFDPTEVRA